VDTPVSVPAIDVGVTAGPVDLGVGVDVANPVVTVDLGDTPISTPALAVLPVVVPVVEEVVSPLRGLLGR
jgi:hypothetical protein